MNRRIIPNVNAYFSMNWKFISTRCEQRNYCRNIWDIFHTNKAVSVCYHLPTNSASISIYCAPLIRTYVYIHAFESCQVGIFNARHFAFSRKLWAIYESSFVACWCRTFGFDEEIDTITRKGKRKKLNKMYWNIQIDSSPLPSPRATLAFKVEGIFKIFLESALLRWQFECRTSSLRGSIQDPQQRTNRIIWLLSFIASSQVSDRFGYSDEWKFLCQCWHRWNVPLTGFYFWNNDFPQNDFIQSFLYVDEISLQGVPKSNGIAIYRKK